MNSDLKLIIIFVISSFSLCFIISLASLILSNKSPNKEKVTVYECGFNPFHSPGQPFSIRFFLIAILFLVFDLEVSFLFPWALGTNHVNLFGQNIVIIFINILILGLIYEWVRGGLEWE